MFEEDMISTFLRMLGLTYQLMLLTASQSNFADIIDKAVKVELAIKARLVQDAPLALTICTRTTPKKAVITRLKANLVQAT